MRYCSSDAPRTGKQNVNLNKNNVSEKLASKKKKKCFIPMNELQASFSNKCQQNVPFCQIVFEKTDIWKTYRND